jgi:flagellar biosynthesis/type III secretory pathway protein FliH
MPETITIDLNKPIKSIEVMDNSCNAATGLLSTDPVANQNIFANELEVQKTEMSQLYQILENLVTKLNQFYEEIFIGHKKEIAKLSVEIARKILTQRVEAGDYKIESIIEEAIKNAPARQDLVIHLNPDDLAQCQKTQPTVITMPGIKLVADPNIGRAECVIESPKGIVESLINEHLEQIGKALEKVE